MVYFAKVLDDARRRFVIITANYSSENHTKKILPHRFRVARFLFAGSPLEYLSFLFDVKRKWNENYMQFIYKMADVAFRESCGKLDTNLTGYQNISEALGN